MPRWAVALFGAALIATACTASVAPDGSDVRAEPTPAATPTGLGAIAPTVAIVMPARAARPTGEIERERMDVEAIAQRAIGNGLISTVRTVVPDRATTVGDVLEVLAEEGNDLVCALGPGAARAVRDVARRFPGTKFCGAPGNLTDVPSNALIFDLRIEESAYLAGIAAAEAANVAGSGGSSAPALIVADSSQSNRLQVAFDQGFSISREAGAGSVVRVATTPAAAFDTADALFEAGVSLIYAFSGRIELGVMQAARAHGALVIGTLSPEVADDDAPGASPSDEGPNPERLMFLGQNLSAAFRDTLDELAAGWKGGQRSIGFVNGALSLTPGTAPDWVRIASQVLSARDALIAGQDLKIVGGG